ncbi:hypothetical protein G9C98_004439 [Cotesia typhae]|uniref:Uncharacterized protein n=1 Tax=Cotesia typhae TaxID=2053667 RepID=A0A8J5QYS9_9HYME|nr:hypothetical protein G9C98_004439 [Cotesia typhae]
MPALGLVIQHRLSYRRELYFFKVPEGFYNRKFTFSGYLGPPESLFARVMCNYDDTTSAKMSNGHESVQQTADTTGNFIETWILQAQSGKSFNSYRASWS